MARKRKPVAAKPPRNPYARLLGLGPFKPKVVKRPGAYVRKPRHRKPPRSDSDEG